MTIALVAAAIVVLGILIAAAYLLPDTSGANRRSGPSTRTPGAPA